MKYMLIQCLSLLIIHSAIASDALWEVSYQRTDDTSELNNTYTQAEVIVLNDPEPQYHNFSSEKDNDWVKFYGIANERYKIEVFDLQTNCDARIRLFYSNQLQEIATADDYPSGMDEQIEMDLLEEGIYYVCIDDAENNWGAETEYKLTVFRPHSCLTHLIEGTIVNSTNKEPVSNAVVQTHLGDTGISVDNGNYRMFAMKCSSNPVDITIQVNGFLTWASSLTLVDGIPTNLQVELTPENQQKNEYYVFDRLWPVQINPFIIDSQKQESVDQTGIGSQIAIDNDGYVYMADSSQSCIKKMDASFNVISQWGAMGSEKGKFMHPQGIALDNENNVYVADTGNHRIQKFSSDGNYITKWGEKGIFPGQLNSPGNIFIHPDQKIYVMDSGNNRYQVFKQMDALPDMKAIVVSGIADSGVFAKTSCHALLYQGYTWDRIAWLSDSVDDRDYNDQIDYPPNKSNLSYCILDWAMDSSSLLIYLLVDSQTDHFKSGTDEIVLFSEFHNWLNELQSRTNIPIIIVYDSGYGQQFISAMSTQTYSRLIITSTADQGNAQVFAPVSFSTYFWQEIISGKSVYDAWNISDRTMNTKLHIQTPQISFYGGTFDQTKSIFIGAKTLFECEQMDIQSFTAHVMPDTNDIYVNVQVESNTIAKAFLINQSNFIMNVKLASSDGYNFTTSVNSQSLDLEKYAIGAVLIQPNGIISEPEVLNVTIPRYVQGDMNDDGFLDLVDLIMILQILAGNSGRVLF